MPAVVVEKKIENPCVKICKMENGYCIGCFRTQDERMKWYQMSRAEQATTLKILEHRRLTKELDQVLGIKVA